MAISIGGVLSACSSIDSSMFCVAWPKSAEAKTKAGYPRSTWDTLWAVIDWSLKACWEGLHPLRDWNGREFDDGSEMQALAGSSLTPQQHRFLVWQLLGDMEYYCNTLGMPHWNCDNFCWQCNCSKIDPSRWAFDFADEPGWEMHDEETLLHFTPSANVLISSIPGGPAAVRPMVDCLHSVEFGLTALLVGGVLHMWCYPEGGLFGADHAAPRAFDVWEQLKQAYSELGTRERFNNLHLNQFCTQSSPWSTIPEMATFKKRCTLTATGARFLGIIKNWAWDAPWSGGCASDYGAGGPRFESRRLPSNRLFSLGTYGSVRSGKDRTKSRQSDIIRLGSNTKA